VVTWRQAISYWETALGLFAWASDAVPGFPAYTVPACPVGLNTEPGEDIEFPGAVAVDDELKQVTPLLAPG